MVAGLLLAATLAGLLLDRYVSLTSLAMLYVLTVVVAAYRLGWIESSVCAAGAVTALNFFFVPPRWTFEVDTRENLIALVTLLVVALVVSRLATGLRRETELARLNESRARQLQALATELADAASDAQVLAAGRAALAAAFAGPCALALADGAGVLQDAGTLAPAVQDGMSCCMKEAAVLGPGTGRWPGLNAWYLPLGDKGQVTGAACVQPALSGDEAGRQHAQALCALLAQALWRLRLAGSLQAAQNEAQQQQLHSTFLAAISHDLRTPLTRLTLRAEFVADPEQQRRMLEEIQRMQAMIDATLTFATQDQRQEPHQATDLAALAQGICDDLADAGLDARYEGPAHVAYRCQPMAIRRALTNIVENACRHGGGAVVTLTDAPDACRILVDDGGPGIPAARYEDVFQPFHRLGAARDPMTGGVGLGLTIARTIVRAHGGDVTLSARDPKGLRVTVSLPRLAPTV